LFVVKNPLNLDHLKNTSVEVKVDLIGVRNYISMGQSLPYIEYSLSLESTNNELLTSFYNLIITDDTKISTSNTDFYVLVFKINKLLENFLFFLGVNNLPKKINEGLIVEEKYDSVTKKLVKDILLTLKYQREGEFVLPEDISDEMVYTFPQFDSEFTINLNLSTSEDVEDVDVDGEYYKGEDTIDINITTNPNIDRQLLEKLYHELNDVVRHEIQHIIQYESGYNFPKREPKKPLKYYTQKHELEAQIAGFKRRAKKEKKPFETVVRDWFRNNSSKHNMTPNDAEQVINLILNYSN
jgi:hypothetical protein